MRAEAVGTGTLAEGIHDAARQRPNALAVADNQSRLSYAQLRSRIGRAMGALDAWGVGTGDPVVLVTGNTVSGVVAYHALLHRGARAVLLDRRCGPADLRYALQATGSERCLVPTAERERLLRGLDVEAMVLDSLGELTEVMNLTVWREPERDAPAVVLFTSGTTSRPKGVLHSLNTLRAGSDNFARIVGASDETTAFLVSPLASITGVMQVHLVSDAHGALVLEDRFDAETSLERINALGATLLGGAPVILERLLEAAGRRSDAGIALRTLALGGAMLPRPLLELATDRFGMEIARVYGSSEAPNFSGSLPEDPRDRRLADDGALMPGSEVRIGSLEHPQEGLLKGPGLFLGYLHPEDDAAAFEDGWFRSGDLMEVDDDRLTVVGRLKEVVNRNGLKVSLSEVDAALAGLPGAREYASFGVPDRSTGERLALAVVPHEGTTVTLKDVVDHLLSTGMARRKLPETVVVWDGPLPRTPSGKVIRARLSERAE